MGKTEMIEALVGNYRDELEGMGEEDLLEEYGLERAATTRAAIIDYLLDQYHDRLRLLDVEQEYHEIFHALNEPADYPDCQHCSAAPGPTREHAALRLLQEFACNFEGAVGGENGNGLVSSAFLEKVSALLDVEPTSMTAREEAALRLLQEFQGDFWPEYGGSENGVVSLAFFEKVTSFLDANGFGDCAEYWAVPQTVCMDFIDD